MKKVVKFKFLEKEGFLSIVEKSNVYYTLVEKDTPKVLDVIIKKKLLISHELKNPVFVEVNASVSYDKDLIKWVYDKLEEEKNLYFKTLDDTLCVIEIEKNN